MNQDLISRQSILKHIEKKRQDALMIDDLRESNIIMMGMKLLDEAVRIQPSAQPDIARDIATIIENEQDMRVILKNERTETHSCENQRAETHDWIPVTERLPENNEEVLTTYIVNGNKNKRYTETATYYDDDEGDWLSPWDEYR